MNFLESFVRKDFGREFVAKIARELASNMLLEDLILPKP